MKKNKQMKKFRKNIKNKINFISKWNDRGNFSKNLRFTYNLRKHKVCA